MSDATTDHRSASDDPSEVAVAKVYAEAFLDAVAGDDKQWAVDELNDFVEAFFDQNPEFESLLLGGGLSDEERSALLERAVLPRLSQLLANFVRVLDGRDRLGLIRTVAAEVTAIGDQLAGRTHVRLVSAQPLAEDQLAAIGERVGSAIGGTAVLDTEVDPALVGGLVIQVGDTVYDASIRTRLRQLRTSLRERASHEIQSGRDFLGSEG
ncbi:MAG: ATP synthase F1 subunit delta [Planctomycetota bacterium]